MTCERNFQSQPEPIVPTNSPVSIENELQFPDSGVPIVPPLNLEEVCSGNPLGFVPNPNSCKSFIVCVFEIGEVNACPSHIPIFDPSRLICVQGKF